MSRGSTYYRAVQPAFLKRLYRLSIGGAHISYPFPACSIIHAKTTYSIGIGFSQLLTQEISRKTPRQLWCVNMHLLTAATSGDITSTFPVSEASNSELDTTSSNVASQLLKLPETLFTCAFCFSPDFLSNFCAYAVNLSHVSPLFQASHLECPIFCVHQGCYCSPPLGESQIINEPNCSLGSGFLKLHYT